MNAGTRVLERLLAVALASMFFAHLEPSEKDLRGSYPSHVHALLCIKPDPGHAIGEELVTFVWTGTLAPGTTAYPFISFHRLHLQGETCTLECAKSSNLSVAEFHSSCLFLCWRP